MSRTLLLLLVAAAICCPLFLSSSPPTSAAGVARGVVSNSSSEHTCLINNAGTVSCWGRNDSGQLGDGTTTNRPSPVPVVGLSGEAVAVATGDLHTCALMAAGTVYCWGQGTFGQLGDNGACGTTCLAPQQITGVNNAIGLAAGWVHTCALLAQGTVTCWGNNYHGQIGNNHVGDMKLPPTQVQQLSGVAAIAAGDWHACALTAGGGLRCWGENIHGQLGDGNQSGMNQALPTNVVGLGSGVAVVAAGGKHSCALLAGGTVRCWGRNDYGQLGIGSVSGVYYTPQTVTGLSGVSRLALGYEHTCAALTSGGMRCWGRNQYGQLGDGSVGTRASPTAVYGVSAPPSSLGLGSYHTCAATPTDGLICWGWNSTGQLGIGSFSDRVIATAIPGLLTIDSDLDGCRDLKEKGPDAIEGGQRNAGNFWDFFDTPEPNVNPMRDQKVDLADVLRVAARFSTTGSPSGNPLSPPPKTGYHTAYDRTHIGPDPWDLGPPDGAIGLTDIYGAVNQFGHTCLD